MNSNKSFSVKSVNPIMSTQTPIWWGLLFIKRHSNVGRFSPVDVPTHEYSHFHCPHDETHEGLGRLMGPCLFNIGIEKSTGEHPIGENFASNAPRIFTVPLRHTHSTGLRPWILFDSAELKRVYWSFSTLAGDYRAGLNTASLHHNMVQRHCCLSNSKLPHF